MPNLVLERAASEIDRTVLIHANDRGPLAVGRAENGINYLCSGCSRIALERVYPRQFLSIVIRCGQCAAISATPSREPGEPVPVHSVVAPVGTYLIGGQLDLPGPGTFAARAAAEDYAFEVGARYSERARKHAATLPQGISADALRQISHDAAALLGDRFDQFEAMYERSSKHSGPTPEHHRLVDLVRYGHRAADQMEAAGRRGQVVLDGNRIAELYAAVSVFHRWRNHPAWPDLVASLADPSHVQHTVTLMSLASYLVDVGNGVGIVHSGRVSGRVPDAWVAVDSRSRMDIEVKTPQAFREPGGALSLDRAVEVVERHVMRAGSRSVGQINRGRTGIIGFGAYHLGQGGIEIVEKAAHEVLRRRGGRRSHIAAIVVAEVTYQTTEIRSQAGKVIAANMQPIAVHRIALNPAYSNDIGISTTTPQWMTMEQAQSASTATPTQPRGYPKVGRNDPCPCGSGRKYKRCHGA